MKLLEKSQEKCSIENETASHHFGQSPHRPRDERGNFTMETKEIAKSLSKMMM